MAKGNTKTNVSLSQEKYVAFLRGINITGNRVIKSVDLKDCFEKMGFGNVVIVLASGNVIFTSRISDLEKIKATIEAGLGKRFHYPAKAVIFRIPDLMNIVKKYPFGAPSDDVHHYVIFLAEDISKELTTGVAIDNKLDLVATGANVIYWQVKKGGTVTTPFGKFIAKPKYRDSITTRNMNTLHKIIAK